VGAEMPKNAVSYKHIPVQQSTFKAGLAAQVHRWFRLTPSFGPDLVREMLVQLRCAKSEVVLDPFSGASTTLIESAFEGQDSYGFEINPFLYWVGKTSINWDIDTTALKDDLNHIIEVFKSEASKIDFSNLEENDLKIPNIHNPLRWWRKDVLTHLLILKRAIHNCSKCQAHRDLFLLGLAGVLVPDLTNVTLGRLQLHFIERDNEEIDVITTFKNHIGIMIADLIALSNFNDAGNAKIFNTNSITLEGVSLEKPISCVITSPPYPNRYSYVWNTRPHLYMLDFFSTSKEAADLDKETIGGTWGSATSMLGKGVIEGAFPFFEDSISPVVSQIRQEDNLMANYVMKYFNLLAEQISAMEKLPQIDLRCAYVIGNSRVKGVYIESDVLLGKIFSSLGYKLTSIERIRKRNSGKDLHESIVYAEKN
jgi:hypothetical protein